MINLVTSEETRPIRHQVLRPGHDFSTTHFNEDGQKNSFHFMFSERDINIGIISIYHEDIHHKPNRKAFRIRGMAVLPDFQNLGIGQQLLDFAVSFLLSNFNFDYIWCNARTTACPFYVKNGFEKVGKEFEIPTIGPHFVLRWNSPLAKNAK